MASPNNSFDLLTVREAASILQVSKAHICNVIAGRVRGCQPIPAVRMGRRMLIRREALAEWIRANEDARLRLPKQKTA